MCLGIPMKVVKMVGSNALCAVDGKQEMVDMMLIGDQPVGTWVLNFLGAAREVMSTEDAEQTRLAHDAVADIMQGNNDIDHLFADLINREPELPEHLQHLVPTSSSSPSKNQSK